ncbi:MAG TPA: hypothetical protein VFL89_08295 [Solirubrobacterales bacterium]|nr:hypothetical protein [Solirubrobacterales bacterium]
MAGSRSRGARAYQGSIRALSLLFIAVGLVLLAVTLFAGGGPLSVGTLMGAVFLAIGMLRLWLSSRMGV